MGNTSEFQCSGLRLVPSTGEFEFAFQFRCSEPSVQNEWGERQEAKFCYFCCLECSNSQQVDGGDLVYLLCSWFNSRMGM